ncbi:GumC family protein [Flavitalea flava]
MSEKNDELFAPDATMDKRSKSMWTMSPKDFIFRYLHYLPWVLISVSLFFFLAYLKIRYTVQIYKVQSSLLIKNDRQNSGGGGEKDQRFDELFMSQGTINLSNEKEILKSRPVLRRVTKDLGLQSRYYSKGSVKTSLIYPDPPFFLDILNLADSSSDFYCKITVLSEEKFLLNESKTQLGFGEIIEDRGNRFRIVRKPNINIHSYGTMVFEASWLRLENADENLIGGLRIGQANEQSTILNLSFESENTALGKDVLNTLMAVYDTLMVEDKNRIADNTLRFINARLLELNDTLRGVQGGLRDYMVQNQVFDIEGQSKAYLDKIGESAKERSEMEVRLAIVGYLLKYIADKKNSYELVPTNLGIEEPALLQLVTEYNKIQLERENNIKTTSPANPLILGLENSLDKIRRDIYQALLNVEQAYSIASNNINRKDEKLQGLVTSLPGKSMQMLNIGRRQKILEDLFSLLLQKRLEISLSSASTISNSNVVEPAIGSNVPVSPDKKSIYVLYILLGFLIPVGVVAMRELLQDKVNGRPDVEKHTDAPILGEIGHSSGEESLVVKHNSRRLISEQFRIIRTNLQYIIGKVERPVIMITSSFSGEGKSFISTNMGGVMALSGKKTVIMEFDIRKPKIVSGLDLKRKMGITNYIIGKASFEDLLVKVEGVDDLYVIPCGPIPPNPAEILLDKRLDELMKEVKANFEVVIMDTAPVGLVSDATNLGRYADCTLYIVREGHTFRNQIRLIDELYVNRKLPSLCLLLNDIKTEGGYYGGGYYGRSYGYYGGGYSYGAGSGYFEEDEAKKGNKNLFKRFIGFWKKLFR